MTTLPLLLRGVGSISLIAGLLWFLQLLNQFSSATDSSTLLLNMIVALIWAAAGYALITYAVWSSAIMVLAVVANIIMTINNQTHAPQQANLDTLLTALSIILLLTLFTTANRRK
jgi:hypothetical protein